MLPTLLQRRATRKDLRFAGFEAHAATARLPVILHVMCLFAC